MTTELTCAGCRDLRVLNGVSACLKFSVDANLPTHLKSPGAVAQAMADVIKQIARNPVRREAHELACTHYRERKTTQP